MGAEKSEVYQIEAQRDSLSISHSAEAASAPILPMSDTIFEELTRSGNAPNIESDPLIHLANEKPELIKSTKRLGQNIIHAEYVPFVHPDTLPTPEEVLVTLTGGSILGNTDKKRIPFAAANIKENAHIESLGLFENAEFYRDGRLIARAAFQDHPYLLKATILRAAELQGIDYDDAGDESPGEILHEYRGPYDRVGQKITQERGWKWPYYGAVDTTPNFILDVMYYRSHQVSEERDILLESVTRKDGTTILVRDSVLAAADWIVERMEANTEGLIEFKRTSPMGIENQVWKDSGDSYSHKDGTLANHEKGVASIEVQVASYEALIGLSEIFPERKEEFIRRAEIIRENIFGLFWIEKEGKGYFAIGTDRDDSDQVRKLDTLTSNAASILDSTLLEGDEEEVVRKKQLLIQTLFDETMWSGGGLRTLASSEVRFHPDAYHNGSVWLQDNADFARGLSRQGYQRLARKVWHKIREVVETTNMYPEKISGDDTSTPHLTHWIVDVMTPERETIRISQPGQILQGFALSAYMEALDFAEREKHALLPQVLNDSESLFEDKILLAVATLEEERRKGNPATIEAYKMYNKESYAAD